LTHESRAESERDCMSAASCVLAPVCDREGSETSPPPAVIVQVERQEGWMDRRRQGRRSTVHGRGDDVSGRAATKDHVPFSSFAFRHDHERNPTKFDALLGLV
jgi:hypothetical protein